MIRERKAQYKDHHTEFAFKKSHIAKDLMNTDRGAMLEHFCPYGLSQRLTIERVICFEHKSVKVADKAISKLILGKAPR